MNESACPADAKKGGGFIPRPFLSRQASTCADFGGRRVTRTDMKTGKSYIIAAMYEGRPLNAPSDITIDEKGRVWCVECFEYPSKAGKRTAILVERGDSRLFVPVELG